jgi:hypothetical protein
LDAGYPQAVEPSIYLAQRIAHRPQKDRLATLLLALRPPLGGYAYRMCKELFLVVVVPVANLAAKLHWRDAHDSTEDLREMALIGEAGRRSCAGQGDLRIAQVSLRAFNSAPQDVLVWG